jgi:hypothetical protein
MWNKSESHIKKGVIYLSTPLAIAPTWRLNPGDLFQMHGDAVIALRSNDPRVQIDPPALVPRTIRLEANAQFCDAFEKYKILLFLWSETRKEFSERDGQVIVTRHVYLLITEKQSRIVTTEPAWIKQLVSAP